MLRAVYFFNFHSDCTKVMSRQLRNPHRFLAANLLVGEIDGSDSFFVSLQDAEMTRRPSFPL